jgi:putative transposase
VIAESAPIRHQLLILNRGRKGAPNLRAKDRIAAGLLTLFMSPARTIRSAIVLKPSTVLHLHNFSANVALARRGRTRSSLTPSWP